MVAKFGTSGLRGLSTELVGDTTLIYTLAFGRYLLETNQISEFDTVYIGRDFRESSPEILELCANALSELNLNVVDCGTLPTPALAYHAIGRLSASLMVTGSHIPADRNGIKFYRPDGEISKVDEMEITRFAAMITKTDIVAVKRANSPPARICDEAMRGFETRLKTFLEAGALSGLRIGVYQHSTVARDLLVSILEYYGAQAIPLGRSETFIPVDTEAVSAVTETLLQDWAAEHQLDAIVSADGDGDRPLVADQTGTPLRGDLLGLISALHLGADAVVTPVTSNSSIEKDAPFETFRTRVGSPFVISGMESVEVNGATAVVGFEANGGVLLQSNFDCGPSRFEALPTRDCFVPILATLKNLAASKDDLGTLARSFGLKAALADRLENYSTDRSSSLVSYLSQNEDNLRDFLAPVGQPVSIDTIDGLRITLDGERIIHLRPSGNAPEMRCYVEASSLSEARKLLRDGLELLSGWTGSNVISERLSA
ncbi:phosphomannomutase [Stappia sp. BW2]|uniref:phosphomannomutase n=1 Tax=Stappia sp. BW2 TaxID=2592622 RepID=UPI0011DEAFB5|nr:phosphomannomutase [Stappia sp. BW2]TYC64043.1 phosphomannomutase [Stappia sp. BW2]